MRTGAVLPRDLFRLLESSELWGSGSVKSFCESVEALVGSAIKDAMICRNVRCTPNMIGNVDGDANNNSSWAKTGTQTSSHENLRWSVQKAGVSSRNASGSVVGSTRMGTIEGGTRPAWLHDGARKCGVTPKCLKPSPFCSVMRGDAGYRGHVGLFACQVVSKDECKLGSQPSVIRERPDRFVGGDKEIMTMHATRFGRLMSTFTENQTVDKPGDSNESRQSSLDIGSSKPAGGSLSANPDNAASYVLMSNIYADGDKWDEVRKINEMRLKARAWKKPGKAYVEIKAKVHEFIVGDRTHQETVNIYEKLRKTKRHMYHVGYVPNVDLILENRSFHDPYRLR